MKRRLTTTTKAKERIFMPSPATSFSYSTTVSFSPPPLHKTLLPTPSLPPRLATFTHTSQGALHKLHDFVSVFVYKTRVTGLYFVS